MCVCCSGGDESNKHPAASQHTANAVPSSCSTPSGKCRFSLCLCLGVFLLRLLGSPAAAFFSSSKRRRAKLAFRIRSLLPSNKQRRGPPRRRPTDHIQKIYLERAHHGCYHGRSCRGKRGKIDATNSIQLVPPVVLRPHLSPLLIQTRSLCSPSFLLPYTTL